MIFSVLPVLFPEKIGLVVGLVIGIIIMVMEQIGLKMGNWGGEIGGWIGNLAVSIGNWMGSWAVGFAGIISSINLLRIVQMLGFFVMVAGLVVILLLPRSESG